MRAPSLAATFLIEHLDLPTATDDPKAVWETFQLKHLNNESLLGVDVKTRQCGWSFTSAATEVAVGTMVPRTNSIFVSINLDEAAEKIRYARQVVEALDREVRPRLVIDNRLELEFGNGSRLISHPCKPVRGKPRARIYLDECAHYPNAQEIYKAALPATTKGGILRLGSSPLGARGLLWEIYTEALRKYPGYKRQMVPWWVVRALCRNVPDASKLAPHMTTEERVKLFGTPRLIEIFENLHLEDFQQEYECAWIDEAVSWITWDEIKRNQVDAQSGDLWHRLVRGKDAALLAIEDVARAVRDGKIESALAGGYDVGRYRNATELVFVGKSHLVQTPFRLGITLENTEFDDQMAVLCAALDRLPVTNLLIDQNGIGMQLAEQVGQRYGARAGGIAFTSPNKELWAVEMKVRLQKSRLPLPLDRDLAYQIHSVRKKVTAANNSVFDTEGNEKHHADKFWALALAVWAALGGDASEVQVGPNPMQNYRG